MLAEIKIHYWINIHIILAGIIVNTKLDVFSTFVEALVGMQEVISQREKFLFS